MRTQRVRNFGLEVFPVRKFSILTAAAVAISAVLPASVCTAQWPGTTRGKDHKHTLEIGGLAYDRPGVDSDAPLISDAETGVSLFDAGDATSVGGAAGLDIKYQFESRGGRTLRFRSIIADFDTSSEINGPAGLASPLLDGATTNRIQYDYDSRLLGFELMSARQIAPGVTFFAGPRYLSIREEVRTQVDGTFDFMDGLPPVPSTDLTNLAADNGLIGLQAGLEINMPVSQYFHVEGFIRGGGYYNPTEVGQSTQTIAGGQFVNPPLLGDRNTKSTGSFLGEVGGRLFVDFIPDAVSGYVGYEATWIDGIALAPAQLVAAPGVVDTANTLFYQAVTFGVQMQF